MASRSEGKERSVLKARKTSPGLVVPANIFHLQCKDTTTMTWLEGWPEEAVFGAPRVLTLPI